MIEAGGKRKSIFDCVKKKFNWKYAPVWPTADNQQDHLVRLSQWLEEKENLNPDFFQDTWY